MPDELHNAITDVPGIRVGHADDQKAITGCTVILCEQGAVGGVDKRGSAVGTRQSDALDPMHVAPQVHAVVLSGGSAFGLESSTGVMRYLEERGSGFQFGPGAPRIPIVPAAILFDLGLGRSDVRPDAEMGHQACLNASSEPPEEGNFGAGTGATVGKAFGMQGAMKSGIGTASLGLAEGLVIAAIVAVNAFGDIIDPGTGHIVAGARATQDGSIPYGKPGYFADTLQIMKTFAGQKFPRPTQGDHTVIGVVATNARLNKVETNKVAQMAQDGVSRTVRPAHTMGDGDTIFALSMGDREADVSTVGALAAEVFAQAILRAVRAARPVAGLPAIPPEEGK